MHYLTNALLLVGALVLIFGMVKAVRALVENRRKERAPFRHYFGPEYDRDLLRQSSWSDDEGGVSDRQTRFEAFNIRAPGANGRYPRVSRTTVRDSDRD